MREASHVRIATAAISAIVILSGIALACSSLGIHRILGSSLILAGSPLILISSVTCKKFAETNSSESKTKNSEPHAPPSIQPPPNHEESASPVTSSALPLTNEIESSAFMDERLGHDLKIYILSFLPTRDLKKIFIVSKQFLKIASSDILWSEKIQKHRIHGALQCKLERDQKNNRYQFELADKSNQCIDALSDHCFRQYKAYKQLRKAIKKNDFILYISRLMKGGPLEFNKIPCLSVPITIKKMTTPLALAIFKGKNQFALRIAEKTGNHMGKPFVLVFTSEKFGDWKQEKNAIWQEETLHVNNTKDINYILAIINREDLHKRHDLQLPHLKKNIVLI